MKIWNWIVNLISSLLSTSKQAFYVVLKGVRKEAQDAVNDPALQELALEAVKKAVQAKLKGDAAWEYAFADFAAAVASRGRELAKNLLDSILQLTYTKYKNATG